MVFSKQAIKNTFRRINAELIIDFKWNGKDYQGTKCVLSQESVYSDFGYSYGYQFSIICTFDDFDILPKEGVKPDIFEVNNQEYRLLRTDTDAAEAAFRVDLGDKFV